MDNPVVPAEAVTMFNIDKLGTVPMPTLPPTITDCPMPTPPVTTKAPEEDEVVAVDDNTDTIPPIVSTLNLLLLDPSLTAKAVVLELLIVITPVEVIVPVLVIAPLLKTTPEIFEA